MERWPILCYRYVKQNLSDNQKSLNIKKLIYTRIDSWTQNSEGFGTEILNLRDNGLFKKLNCWSVRLSLHLLMKTLGASLKKDFEAKT